MATEYRFYAAAEVTADEFADFLVDALGGSLTREGFVAREGLMVTAYRVVPGEEASAADLFGFTHRVTATFRFSNTAAPHVRDTNVVLMVQAVLRFLDRYPGSGVLLFNGEEVVLQRLDDTVELSSDWEEWTDVSQLSHLIGRYDRRPLPQPLL
jgi:hypothetical protein